ncbi:hypothetical protein Bbelb_130430 [Branchiostoma belcheri]|nr:hypothetical protein Bbelb_130430 [Branchiostoma belcheri]
MEELSHKDDIEDKLQTKDGFCDLCQSGEDTTVLLCRHRFCHPCLGQLQATEREGELTCVVCSSHAPLPQNGARQEDKKGYSQSKLPGINTIDGTAETQPTRQQQPEKSKHSEQKIATFNSVQEELPSESEAPNVDQRNVVTTGKPKEGHVEDVEYFLCLNNSDTKNSPKGTVEKELPPEPKETDTTEYEDTRESGDINHFQDLNIQDVMAESEREREKSYSGSTLLNTATTAKSATSAKTTTATAVRAPESAAKTTRGEKTASTTTPAAKAAATTTAEIPTIVSEKTTTAEVTTPVAAKTTVAEKTTTAEVTTPAAKATITTTETTPVAAKTTTAEIPTVSEKTTTEVTTPVAEKTTTAEVTTTPIAEKTTKAEVTTTVAEKTATAEVTTSVAAKTTTEEVTTPVADKTTTAEVTTPVEEKTAAEVTTPVEEETTTAEVTTPVAAKTRAEVQTTVAEKTTTAEATKTTPVAEKTTTAAAATTTTTEATEDPVRQEEVPRRSHRLNSEDRKYILVSKKGRKSQQGESGDSKLHVRFDMAASTVIYGQIGAEEMTESLQHGDEDKKGVNVCSPGRDLGTQPKELSPHHKKGTCKCSRGEVKTVHCSVCQKYVCLHCATHEHKDHSEEEIQEALDKEKDKIKHGLDIASTCAEAHHKRVDELAESEQNLLNQFENMSIRIADHSEIALSLINERVESIVQAVQDEAEKVRESVRSFKAESLEDLIAAFEERRKNIAEEREAAQVAFAASSSYTNISRKILEDGSSAVVLTSSNSLSEVFKTLKYPHEKTPVPSVIPPDYDRRLWFMAPQVDLNGEIQKWFGKVVNGSCKEIVAEGTKREAKSPASQQCPTLIATLKSATTQLHRTFSLATDEENDIIVAGQNIVRIFSSDTMRLKSAVALAFNPEGLAAYGDEIFVTGNGHNIHVLKKSGDSRRVLHVEGVLSRLQGLAVDTTGRIIATEGRQVFVLLPDGTEVCTFDVASEGGPVRLYPATNSSDRIIISDQSGHTIKLYDASGNLIRQMGGKGKDDGQLLSPADVCADAEDNIIVADTKNNRVSQFNPEGTFDKHLVVEENYVRFPWAVAMTGDGRLVVSSLAVGQAVKVFDLHKNSS